MNSNFGLNKDKTSSFKDTYELSLPELPEFGLSRLECRSPSTSTLKLAYSTAIKELGKGSSSSSLTPFLDPHPPMAVPVSDILSSTRLDLDVTLDRTSLTPLNSYDPPARSAFSPLFTSVPESKEESYSTIVSIPSGETYDLSKTSENPGKRKRKSDETGHDTSKIPASSSLTTIDNDIQVYFESYLESTLEPANALIKNCKNFVAHELINKFSNLTKIEENEIKWKDPHKNHNANKVGNRTLFSMNEFHQNFFFLLQKDFFNAYNIRLFRKIHLQDIMLFGKNFLKNHFFEPIFNEPHTSFSYRVDALSNLFLVKLIILRNKQARVTHIWLIDNSDVDETTMKCWRNSNFKQLLVNFMYESYVDKGIELLSNDKDLPYNFWSICRLYDSWLSPARLNEKNKKKKE